MVRPRPPGLVDAVFVVGSRVAGEKFFAVQTDFANRRFANPGDSLDLVLGHEK